MVIFYLLGLVLGGYLLVTLIFSYLVHRYPRHAVVLGAWHGWAGGRCRGGRSGGKGRCRAGHGAWAARTLAAGSTMRAGGVKEHGLHGRRAMHRPAAHGWRALTQSRHAT